MIVADPDYARVLSIARCIGWSEGWNVIPQGTGTRDLDLVAVPWSERVCEPEHLVRRLCHSAQLHIAHGPGVKPHGRLGWTLRLGETALANPADPRWIDFAVMPTQTPPATAQTQEPKV